MTRTFLHFTQTTFIGNGTVTKDLVYEYEDRYTAEEVMWKMDHGFFDDIVNVYNAVKIVYELQVDSIEEA